MKTILTSILTLLIITAGTVIADDDKTDRKLNFSNDNNMIEAATMPLPVGFNNDEMAKYSLLESDKIEDTQGEFFITLSTCVLLESTSDACFYISILESVFWFALIVDSV